MQNAALGSAFIITDPARIVKQIAELAPQRKFGGKRRTGGIKYEGRNGNVRRGMLEHATGDIRARGRRHESAAGRNTRRAAWKRTAKTKSVRAKNEVKRAADSNMRQAAKQAAVFQCRRKRPRR